MIERRLFVLLTAVLMVGCGTSTKVESTPNQQFSAAAPDPDPRVGLRAGLHDAGVAAWNMRLLSNTPSPQPFAAETNSDLAFTGNYAIQGNYNGFQIWDISNARKPVLKIGYVCPASQSDVSVFHNLLFVSGEGLGGRKDCGTQGVPDTVSLDRLRGIRIFDISDVANPKYIANVQTCRGSHTHTVVTDPNDKSNVYVYVSGYSSVRSPSELPGCSALTPDQDPNSALFRIEVIKVPLNAPQQAAIVSSPRIFSNLGPPPVHAENPADTVGRRARAAARPRANPTGSDTTSRQRTRTRTGPTQCHDITAYPAIGLAGGACVGYGLLLDIRDVANPKRIAAVADSNFSFWHSATFSNDGSKVLFSDEWGGGRGARCRATDKLHWGANAIFAREGTALTLKSYYKMPAPQTAFENCTAHNGSLIPIPGRDVMVQSWYQGGVSVFDWTDPAHPKEVAFFDRGPLDSTKLVDGGTWSAYWYNGVIVSSEESRGLDILELTPGALISQNEIDAAKTVRTDYFNAQDQQQIVWPATFALARAYLDQLARTGGLAGGRIEHARTALRNAEKRTGEKRRVALSTIAAQLNADAPSAADPVKVRAVVATMNKLAEGAR